MSIFKENVSPEKKGEIDTPLMREMDTPRVFSDIELRETPFSDFSDVFDAAFKNFGLNTDMSENKKSDIEDTCENQDYSNYLEKGEDGKYYDKETGKSYDSIEAWVKSQETLKKRYESTATFYEEKAKKEWARFKNAEDNGETDAEKWTHYRCSQECYEKANEYKEKAEKTRIKLGETSDKNDLQDSMGESRDEVKETNLTRELTEEEKQHFRENNCSENLIESIYVDAEGNYRIKSRNQELEGKTHPETGVPFVDKTLIIAGCEVHIVEPKFPSAFECEIDPEKWKSGDREIFKDCTEQLQNYLEEHPEMKEKFNEQQLEQIKNGEPYIKGYTWHHTEEPGKMQLVETNVHARTGHTGGNSIWCDGIR